MPRAVFARINRRQLDQQTFAMGSFRDEMVALADSNKMRYREDRPRSSNRIWAVRDMTIQPDDNFMGGILGYTMRNVGGIFEGPGWSWIKDKTKEDIVVPFAIDLREAQRWVCFAPSARLRHKMFASGLSRVLNSAVAEADLTPVEWEVDLVCSIETIDEWLHRHPAVHRLKRIMKRSNPGRDLDEDRREMRALNARHKVEEFHAGGLSTLDIRSERFRGKVLGTDTGDLDVELQSHEMPVTKDAFFRSENSPDQSIISGFSDLFMGIEIVVQALREYLRHKGIGLC